MAERATRTAGEIAGAPRRGPETREAIDRAALGLFARVGYHAASMRAIASAAEVQPAAIYHWYSGKESILVHLQNDFMERLTAEVTAGIDRQSTPVLRLAAAVREHVVFHGRHRLGAFVTDSEIRALGPQAREALVARRDAYQAMFGELIRDGIREGTLQSSDAHVATYAILLQCTGVSLWFDPEGPLRLEEVAELHVELVLAALRAAPEQIAAAIHSVGRGPAVAEGARQ